MWLCKNLSEKFLVKECINILNMDRAKECKGGYKY